MSVLREALVLPALFLSVTLLGGLRIGAAVRFVPPPLIALVLGLLLLAALVRAHAIQPAAFVREQRAALENLSGVVVLLSLAAASVQVFTLVTPDRGLLHVLFGTFFFVQLLSTIAGTTDRRALLRSLTVLLGSAFVLRYIVLESLYAPGGGMLTRLLTVLMEGITLGSLQYDPAGAATGYLAFAALAFYLIGLFLLLPPARPTVALELRRSDASQLVRLLLLVSVVGGAACRAPSPPPEATKASSNPSSSVPAAVREDALRSARVWAKPATAVGRTALGTNPPGIPDDQDITCKFVVKTVGGTTPKFNCALPSGEVVKVKYGAGNPELHAEVAATRLLAALGFSADRMFVVRSVRCLGCPAVPFTALRCLAETGIERACLAGGLDFEQVRAFTPAVIERRLEGRVIESAKDQGWAWFELDRIDATAGGSPRAEVDALRLLAALLAHWDNKSENQRLVCPPGMDRPDGGCAAPVAVIQDLGATFGPVKLDLPNWRATPLWRDASTCHVSLKQLPFGGGTFPDVQISEEGRLQLLGLLEQLSEAQLTDLFTASGATTFDAVNGEGRAASAWVAAFRDKVGQMRKAGPCPPAATLAATAAK